MLPCLYGDRDPLGGHIGRGTGRTPRGRFADFGFSNSWKRAEGGKSFSSGGGLRGGRMGIRRRRLGCGREEGVSGAGAFVAVAGSW